ncbi:GSCFA domain-containing protein [Burkholderia sp. Ap-962]|uniref:GSCFA domain-containing protein n=1 Tax=Burkholderia sp. Ap-962 TaxID=2608333 RepID=UPI001423E66B|nr:GSCFA domain-containing protein [Burkholderia sp. Ap-962]
MTNPYQGIPDHQFWRKGVAGIDAFALDPVSLPKFRIQQTDKVATAGSCFAQHISSRLSKLGFNYYVPEHGEPLPAEERARLGYGVFSARFGNLYTTRQLLQLFEESMSHRVKNEIVWQRADGRYVDAFRPAVTPEGYGSAADVIAARAEHLHYVKCMFLESDVFIFTLGLTESWSNRAHGEVFPLAPGVAGGQYEESKYQFTNLGVNEVVADLQSFLYGLKLMNPGVRVLLTVSPVPLIATYEKKNALVATTYSKSVLRVAAETVTHQYDWVDYFPSYEIITGNFNAGRYYEADLREVNSMGVGHAMRSFLRNYVAEQQVEAATPAPNAPTTADASAASITPLGSLVCDEELIEQVSR